LSRYVDFGLGLQAKAMLAYRELRNTRFTF